jgi:hypothetical protein
MVVNMGCLILVLIQNFKNLEFKSLVGYTVSMKRSGAKYLGYPVNYLSTLRKPVG